MTHLGFELELRLPPARSRSARRELHGQLRAAILDGRLAPGVQLPPTRALADTLGLSRNTVVVVYDQLLSEGYITARAGAGTFVAPLAARTGRPNVRKSTDRARLNETWRRATAPMAPSRPPIQYDFRLGFPDASRFPFDIWGRLSGRALRAFAREAPGYRAADGRRALREAIAGHVSFARAVACAPDDILVTAGAQQAFDLLARVLVTPGESIVAVEEPGYAPTRAVFAAAGAQVKPVPVDDEGLMVDRLPHNASVVCVTPSHQFPLGVAMSPQRRRALLAFAARRGAVIIEDDYDGEFRFGGRPLDALQTLDRHAAVFYVGTFSKSLFPALRLGFVVAPGWARPALLAAKRLADWHGPSIEQDTLAAFIAEGHLARHVRRMRKIYEERRAAVLSALHAHCADALEPIPSAAGLHVATRLRRPLNVAAAIERAAKAGIAVEPVPAAAFGPSAAGGLAFGYGAIEAHRIAEAIRRLAATLR